MTATMTETNQHFRIRSGSLEDKKKKTERTDLRCLLLDRTVIYPDSLPAAYSNEDLAKAISFDQLSQAASRTSVNSLGLSQVISEPAENDRRLEEDEWEEEEHTQTELHITRSEDAVISETDATIVHMVRRRSIRYGPESESSGTSSHGSDVMIEISDVSSTCIMVTGDEATINQTQESLRIEQDELEHTDNLVSKSPIKENDNEQCSKIDCQTYSGHSAHHALPTADEEYEHHQQILTDKETVLNTTATDSITSENAVTLSSQPASNLEVQAEVTSETSMAEKEKEERENDEKFNGRKNEEKDDKRKNEEKQDEKLNEERDDDRENEEEEEEEVETDEGAFAGDEASQSASASSILSPSENASASSSIIPSVFFQNESTRESSNKTTEIIKSDGDAVLDPVASLIDLGDVDVIEKVGQNLAVNFPQTEEDEEDNTPVLSTKFSTTTYPKRDQPHNLHQSMRHVTLEGGKGELMAVQQKLIDMEKEQIRLRDQMEFDKQQWKTITTDLQESLEQLQTKLDYELKKRDAQIRVLEKRLRSTEGRVVNINQQSSAPLERSGTGRRSTRVSTAQAEKLRRFFGDTPPLLDQFMNDLGYKEYIPRFHNERIGLMELPHLSEWDLINLGIPLGPRLRILHEAQSLTSL